ncbi:hypothetical protein JTB14_004205 [Gonioctena quinquepunctata]|nr:hypothetical protein JTB14_004205 [Gonioctena quinquepunctata]
MIVSIRILENENKVNTEEGYVCKTKMAEQEAYTTTLNSQLRTLHIEHKKVVEINQNLKKEKIKVENAKFHDSMTTLLDENKENKTALEELKLTQSNILMKAPSDVKYARQTLTKEISMPRLKKIIILADETGRGLNKELRRRFINEYIDISSIMKPGASYDKVIDNIENLTLSFTCQDLVIVMAGKNDFSRNKYPSIRNINHKLKMCNTNVIFLSTPMLTDLHSDRITNFNKKFNYFLEVFNKYNKIAISWLNINNSYGQMLSKYKISLLIKKTGIEKRNNNLTFIETVECPNMVAERFEVSKGQNTVLITNDDNDQGFPHRQNLLVDS